MINEALEHRYDCTVNPCQTQLTAPGKVEPQPNEEDKCCIASSCRLESRPQCLESPGWEKGAIHALYCAHMLCYNSTVWDRLFNNSASIRMCTVHHPANQDSFEGKMGGFADLRRGRRRSRQGSNQKQPMVEKRIIDWYNWHNWFN